MKNSISLMMTVGLAIAGVCGVNSAANAADTTFQAADMMWFSNGQVLPGAGTLVRGENDLWAHLDTTRLAKNAAHTVWWAIFNDPSACVDMCDFDDLSIPETRASIVYAGSIVSGDDRNGSVSAHLTGGEIPMGAPVQLGSGLEEYNGYHAAVVVIIRSHGKVLSGHVAEQIGSFNGGCDINVCADVQMVGFPPIME